MIVTSQQRRLPFATPPPQVWPREGLEQPWELLDQQGQSEFHLLNRALRRGKRGEEKQYMVWGV